MQYNISKEYDPKVLEKLHKVQIEILMEFDRICKKHGLRYFGIYGTAIGAVRHQGFIPWDDDVDVGMLREEYDKFLSIAKQELGNQYQIMTPLEDAGYACTVTHLQRKGTKFIPHFSKTLTCEMCIDLDIFPFDAVAPTQKLRKRQANITTFLGRLLFLTGTPYPVIPLQGVKRKMASAVCFVTYYFLKIFHVTPPVLYRKFLKEACRYNSMPSEYVTSFEYAGSVKDKILKKEIFPLQEVAFEKISIPLPANNKEFLEKVYGNYMELPPKEQRVNHCPYLIQFEGEEPIIDA